MAWELTAEELAVEWLTWLRDVRRRPQTTWVQYGRVLNAWLKWCARLDINPIEPSLPELEKFMIRARRNGRIGSAATQKQDATVLRTWFQWMIDRDYRIGKNPANLLYAPTVTATRGKPLPDWVWQDLWSSDHSALVRVALGMGYFAGLRTFEIESTPRVKLGSDLITVVRKGGKTQVIPWKKLALVIHHRLPHLLPDARVFINAVNVVRSSSNERMYPFDFKNTFAHLVNGMPGHYTPHMLRHSTATNLLTPQVNMPVWLVQEYMGHASVEDTMRYVREVGSRLEEYYPELRGHEE